MTTRKFALPLALMLAVFVSSVTVAQPAEQITVYDPDQVMTLVAGASLIDAMANLERKLTDKGFRKRIEGAFAGQRTTSIYDDITISQQSTKIVMIPYTNLEGNKTTWILAAIQNAEGGDIIQILLTPTTTTCNDCDQLTAAEGAGQMKVAQIRPLSIWDDLQIVLQEIRSGNISFAIGYQIGSLIRRGLADWIMAPQIKAAYQSRGYICTDPPWWMFIPKSIWYAATCAIPVR